MIHSIILTFAIVLLFHYHIEEEDKSFDKDANSQDSLNANIISKENSLSGKKYEVQITKKVARNVARRRNYGFLIVELR